MTATDIQALTNQAAGVLVAIRHLLDRPGDPTQATEGHAMAAPNVPAADALERAAEDLDRYAGPALAAPITRVANNAANALHGYAAMEAALKRHVNDLDSTHALAVELLAQAADVLDALGSAYTDAVEARIVAEARCEVTEEVLDRELRADGHARAHRAGVMREANKRAGRLITERRRETLGLVSDGRVDFGPSE